MSPSGKAQDFDSCIRAFEPRHPSQTGLAVPAHHDSVAQQAEQLPFKQWVRGSNPRWVTKYKSHPIGDGFYIWKIPRRGFEAEGSWQGAGGALQPEVARPQAGESPLGHQI